MKTRRLLQAWLCWMGAATALRARDPLAEAILLYDSREYSPAALSVRCTWRLRTIPRSTSISSGSRCGSTTKRARWRICNAGAAASPREARVQNALGDAYGLAAQNANVFAKLAWAKKCRAAYERAIELDPVNPAFRWSVLGFCLVAPRIAGGGFEKARAQADPIAALDPVGGRIAHATLALAEERFDAAFAELDQLLRERPDDFTVLYQIGRCAGLSGRELKRGLAALAAVSNCSRRVATDSRRTPAFTAGSATSSRKREISPAPGAHAPPRSALIRIFVRTRSR